MDPNQTFLDMFEAMKAGEFETARELALGNQATFMSKQCGNERMAMTLQYVALGSMIIMAGYTARKMLKEAFGDDHHSHGRSH